MRKRKERKGKVRKVSEGVGPHPNPVLLSPSPMSSLPSITRSGKAYGKPDPTPTPTPMPATVPTTGYKVFDRCWTGPRQAIYPWHVGLTPMNLMPTADKVVGTRLVEQKEPVPGGSGFHYRKTFHEVIASNESMFGDNHYMQVEVNGKSVTASNGAMCTNDMTILREIPRDECKALARAGCPGPQPCDCPEGNCGVSQCSRSCNLMYYHKACIACVVKLWGRGNL